MNDESLPDLEQGYMIMGYDAANRWQTKIESLLMRTRGDGSRQMAYLSHECRAEAVGEAIFGPNIYEFAALKGWEGNFLLRGGSFNYSFHPGKNRPPAVDSKIYEPASFAIEVHDPLRPVRHLDFAQALEIHQRPLGTARPNIFLDIRFFLEGADYRLLLPARYMNFSNPEKACKEPYLQPISGQAIFSEGGRYYTAYAAAHLTRHGTQTLEFMLRQPLSFIQSKNKASAFYRLFALLDRLLLSHIFVTDDFWVHRIIQGECRLFTYLPQGE